MTSLKKGTVSADEAAMSLGIPDYEPRIIEQFAENLYKKASAFVAGSCAIGGTVGAAFGSVPLTSLGAAWPIPQYLGFATLLVGGLVGAVIGYVIGDARSFGYRLQAQTALCQLQSERNSAVAAESLAKLAATVARQQQQQPAQRRAAAPAPAAARAPASAPASAPAAPVPAAPAAAPSAPREVPPLTAVPAVERRVDAAPPVTVPPQAMPPLGPSQRDQAVAAAPPLSPPVSS